MKSFSYWRIPVIGLITLILLSCSIFSRDDEIKSMQSTIDALSAQLEPGTDKLEAASQTDSEAAESKMDPPAAESKLEPPAGDKLSAGDGGYIAYVAGNDIDAPLVRQDLFVVKPDGSDPLKLNGASLWNDAPVWSPDGRRLAFWSDVDGNRDIYLLDLSSHTVERLTDDPDWDIHPSWSPDGLKILFVSDRSGVLDLYMMNPDGSGQEVLFSSEYNKTYPVWSPDGKYIAFMEKVGYDSLKIIPFGGKDETPVGLAMGRAAWSPDGRFLAYAGIANDLYPELPQNMTNNPDIMVYDFLTEKRTRLTDNPGVDAFPVWSPDGKRLVYDSDQGDPLLYTRSLYQIEFKEPVENLEINKVSLLFSGEGMKVAWSPVDLPAISAPPVIMPVPPPLVRVCPSGCEYDSIQKAIDSAKGILTIQVESGIYGDPLVIDKPVRLQGVDTGNGQPVIDIPVNDSAVQILASNVTVQGFQFVNNAYNSQTGSLIYITSDFNSFTGNKITCGQIKNPAGIRLSQANFNMIQDNDFGNCGNISLGASSYNQVMGNNLTSESLHGISVSSNYDKEEVLPPHRTTAMFNVLANNVTSSIFIDHESHQNRIVSNTVFLPQDDETARGRMGKTEEVYSGDILLNCGPELNLVGANQMESYGDGILLTSAGVFNMILRNQMNGGNHGILLDRSFMEMVYGNRVSGVSGYGIYIGAPLSLDNAEAAVFGTGGNHLVYGNVLIGNSNNATDNSIDHEYASMLSLWDNGVIGNYYSDYDEISEGCPDADGDKICDLPYMIPGEQGAMDHFPLMDQQGE